MTFENLSIEEFKAEAKAHSIQIVRNPNTKKLFASAAGTNYKVQGADAKRGELDVTKPIEYLIEVSEDAEGNALPHTDEQFAAGCFVNQGEDNVLHTM
jgi:hypothetical protein